MFTGQGDVVVYHPNSFLLNIDIPRAKQAKTTLGPEAMPKRQKHPAKATRTKNGIIQRRKKEELRRKKRGNLNLQKPISRGTQAASSIPHRRCAVHRSDFRLITAIFKTGDPTLFALLNALFSLSVQLHVFPH
ncbi:hypothetical protein L2E82_30107 [Cichorium intybus]|uniref:Uncharacterized protein n=1 Tax=Cichorium intybus TaxID=13427 RepID=A0ACB9CZK6_CICIN|nr:hypothetical protein L2E82_30107 [Cichorium intybus]